MNVAVFSTASQITETAGSRVIYTCPVCLAKNRKLILINGDSSKMMVTLGIFTKANCRKAICWECYANVQNILRFQRTALYSKKLLSQDNLAVVSLANFSKLQKTRKVYCLSITPTSEENMEVRPQPPLQSNKIQSLNVKLKQGDLTKLKESRKPLYIVVNKAVSTEKSTPTLKRHKIKRIINNDKQILKGPIKPVKIKTNHASQTFNKSVKKPFDKTNESPTMDGNPVEIIDTSDDEYPIEALDSDFDSSNNETEFQELLANNELENGKVFIIKHETPKDLNLTRTNKTLCETKKSSAMVTDFVESLEDGFVTSDDSANGDNSSVILCVDESSDLILCSDEEDNVSNLQPLGNNQQEHRTKFRETVRNQSSKKQDAPVEMIAKSLYNSAYYDLNINNVAEQENDKDMNYEERVTRQLHSNDVHNVQKMKTNSKNILGNISVLSDVVMREKTNKDKSTSHELTDDKKENRRLFVENTKQVEKDKSSQERVGQFCSENYISFYVSNTHDNKSGTKETDTSIDINIYKDASKTIKSQLSSNTTDQPLFDKSNINTIKVKEQECPNEMQQEQSCNDRNIVDENLTDLPNAHIPICDKNNTHGKVITQECPKYKQNCEMQHMTSLHCNVQIDIENMSDVSNGRIPTCNKNYVNSVITQDRERTQQNQISLEQDIDDENFNGENILDNSLLCIPVCDENNTNNEILQESAKHDQENKMTLEPDLDDETLDDENIPHDSLSCIPICDKTHANRSHITQECSKYEQESEARQEQSIQKVYKDEKTGEGNIPVVSISCNTVTDENYTHSGITGESPKHEKVNEIKEIKNRDDLNLYNENLFSHASFSDVITQTSPKDEQKGELRQEQSLEDVNSNKDNTPHTSNPCIPIIKKSATNSVIIEECPNKQENEIQQVQGFVGVSNDTEITTSKISLCEKNYTEALDDTNTDKEHNMPDHLTSQILVSAKKYRNKDIMQPEEYKKYGNNFLCVDSCETLFKNNEDVQMYVTVNTDSNFTKLYCTEQLNETIAMQAEHQNISESNNKTREPGGNQNTIIENKVKIKPQLIINRVTADIPIFPLSSTLVNLNSSSAFSTTSDTLNASETGNRKIWTQTLPTLKKNAAQPTKTINTTALHRTEMQAYPTPLLIERLKPTNINVRMKTLEATKTIWEEHGYAKNSKVRQAIVQKQIQKNMEQKKRSKRQKITREVKQVNAQDKNTLRVTSEGSNNFQKNDFTDNKNRNVYNMNSINSISTKSLNAIDNLTDKIKTLGLDDMSIPNINLQDFSSEPAQDINTSLKCTEEQSILSYFGQNHKENEPEEVEPRGFDWTAVKCEMSHEEIDIKLEPDDDVSSTISASETDYYFENDPDFSDYDPYENYSDPASSYDENHYIPPETNDNKQRLDDGVLKNQAILQEHNVVKKIIEPEVGQINLSCPDSAFHNTSKGELDKDKINYIIWNLETNSVSDKISVPTDNLLEPVSFVNWKDEIYNHVPNNLASTSKCTDVKFTENVNNDKQIQARRNIKKNRKRKAPQQNKGSKIQTKTKSNLKGSKSNAIPLSKRINKEKSLKKKNCADSPLSFTRESNKNSKVEPTTSKKDYSIANMKTRSFAKKIKRCITQGGYVEEKHNEELSLSLISNTYKNSKLDQPSTSEEDYSISQYSPKFSANIIKKENTKDENEEEKHNKELSLSLICEANDNEKLDKPRSSRKRYLNNKRSPISLLKTNNRGTKKDANKGQVNKKELSLSSISESNISGKIYKNSTSEEDYSITNTESRCLLKKLESHNKEDIYVKKRKTEELQQNFTCKSIKKCVIDQPSTSGEKQSNTKQAHKIALIDFIENNQEITLDDLENELSDEDTVLSKLITNKNSKDLDMGFQVTNENNKEKYDTTQNNTKLVPKITALCEKRNVLAFNKLLLLPKVLVRKIKFPVHDSISTEPNQSTSAIDEETLNQIEDELTDEDDEMGPNESNAIDTNEQTDNTRSLYNKQVKRQTFKRRLRFKVNISEKEAEILREEKKRSATFRNALFKCLSCVQIFDRKTNLTFHINRYHKPEIGPYLCQICFCHFTNEDNLSSHLISHKKFFKCRWCDEKSLDAKSLKKHVIFKHKEVLSDYRVIKNYCVECGQIFLNRRALESHLKSEHSTEDNRILEADRKTARLEKNRASCEKNVGTPTVKVAESAENVAETMDFTVESTGNDKTATAHVVQTTKNNTATMESVAPSTDNVVELTANVVSPTSIFAGPTTSAKPTRIKAAPLRNVMKRTRAIVGPSANVVQPTRIRAAKAANVVKTSRNVAATTAKNEKRTRITAVPTTNFKMPKRFIARPTANVEVPTENVEPTDIVKGKRN